MGLLRDGEVYFTRYGAHTSHRCGGPWHCGRGPKESGRDRYVSDDEFRAVWEKAGQTLRDAMDLALLTGQRPADVLKVQRGDSRIVEKPLAASCKGLPMNSWWLGRNHKIRPMPHQRKIFLALVVRGTYLGTPDRLCAGEITGCLLPLSHLFIGKEARRSAHHWARTLQGFGHAVRLISPQSLRPLERMAGALFFRP